MMLTREQAAEVWCPMALTRISSMIPAYNATSDMRVPPDSRCASDRCAMWRWGETKPEWQTRVVGLGGGAKRIDNVRVDVPHRGYCGLAGAPTISGGAD